MTKQPFVVDVLLYEGCVASEAFAVTDVLRMANTLAMQQGFSRTELFKVSLVSIDGCSVCVSAGVTIAAMHPSTSANLIVVPGLHFENGDDLINRLSLLGPQVSYLQRIFGANRTVASICVGAFLLAEAGALNGRRATTAWIVARMFARRYPGVMLDRDQLLVSDQSTWTTGAVTAAFDLALALVRDKVGGDFAALLSKMILVDHDRRLQSPFVLTGIGDEAKSDSVGRACNWLRLHIHSPFDLSALAKHCATSTRTLQRLFQIDIGCSPLQFFHNVKVERAKSLLETTNLRISELPNRLGYIDESAFRAIFVRSTGMTPTTYRRRFRRSDEVVTS